MLCDYSCGNKGTYKIGEKNCCEEIRQRCPAQKSKFLKSRKKVICKRCGKTIAKNSLSRHLKVCNTSFCKNCKISIDGSRLFCSSSCSASYNNKKRIKITLNSCLYCKKKTRNIKFCSKDCSNKYRKKLTWDKIKEGKCSQNSTLRKHFIDHFGNKCWICGNTIWQEEPIPLILDHINGNPYDNSFKNLRLVCANCDMQLPTYKSKNIGNGRHYRKERYKKGKSF